MENQIFNSGSAKEFYRQKFLKSLKVLHNKDDSFICITLPSSSCLIEAEILEYFKNVKLIVIERDKKIHQTIKNKLPTAILFGGTLELFLDIFEPNEPFSIWADTCSTYNNQMRKNWSKIANKCVLGMLTILAGHDKYSGHDERISAITSKIDKDRFVDHIELYYTKLNKGGVSAPMISFGVTNIKSKDIKQTYTIEKRLFKEKDTTPKSTKILQLRKNGIPCKDISGMVGCSLATVYRTIKKSA